MWLHAGLWLWLWLGREVWVIDRVCVVCGVGRAVRLIGMVVGLGTCVVELAVGGIGGQWVLLRILLHNRNALNHLQEVCGKQ